MDNLLLPAAVNASLPAPARADENPVAVYLASLANGSRRTMAAGCAMGL